MSVNSPHRIAVLLLLLASACGGPGGDASATADGGAGSQADGGAGEDGGAASEQDAGESREDAGEVEEIPAPTFVVNDGLTPQIDSVIVQDGEAPQPVALVETDGISAEFVLGELLVATDERSDVEALAKRWDGEIVETQAFDGVPDVHTVHIDPSGVDTDDMAALLEELGGEATGQHEFSERAALELFAVSLEESLRLGVPVSLNWLLEQDDALTGESVEAPNGAAGYSPDAFDWTYMTNGSVQDTGVTSAWQLLALQDVTRRARLAIIDSGFVNIGDYGTRPSNVIGAEWGTPSGAGCDSDGCRWHGTAVAHTAGALPDNGIGVVGSGAQHVALELFQITGASFRGVMRLLGYVLALPLSGAPAAVNISGSVEVPAGLNVAVNRLLDPLLDHALRLDVLLVAAAGNDGKSVDRKNRLGLWETSTVVPCESSSVICVGGLSRDSTRAHPNSNVSSEVEADSVDIYAPFDVYVPEIDEDGAFTGRIVEGSGTSYATPFVSGVIALMKAANPDMSAAGLTRCLLSSAHDMNDVRVSGNQRRVDAFEAVKCAMRRVDFPLLKVMQPDSGSYFAAGAGVKLQAASLDDEGNVLPIRWNSDVDGDLQTTGSGATSAWRPTTPGLHVLTATVRTADGDEVSEELTITVENAAPSVDIVLPRDGTIIREGQAITVSAVSSDPNLPAGTQLADAQITWSVSPGGWTGAGHMATIPGGSLDLGSYTLTVTADDGELTTTDTTTFSISSCTGECPVPIITTPSGDIVIRTAQVDAQGLVVAEVDFAGIATDAEDGTLSGRRKRWEVVNEAGARTTVCMPIELGNVQTTCDSFTTVLRLDLSTHPQGTTYLVTLIVTDSDDNEVRSEPVAVTLEYDLI